MNQATVKADLIAFEKDIAEEFLAAHIRAPIHLSGGNEDQLIDMFKNVRLEDWVFSTWRSHYHALLKGIPAERLKSEIIAGRSMYIISREHKVISSAIVGGILPIALGVALGIKRLGGAERVWCFVGDMAARTGIYEEVSRYAAAWELPLSLVIEDNGFSTNTPTQAVWGERRGESRPVPAGEYHYERVWPHTGVGKWVTFG